MSVSDAFCGVVDESVESIELAAGANGFQSPDAAHVVTTRCGRRLTICWRPKPATRFMPDNANLTSKSVIVWTIDSIRNHSRWPAPPTAKSWSDAQETASRPSRAWPPRSRPWRSTRLSWWRAVLS